MALEDVSFSNDLVYLDPRRIRFFRTDDDPLRLTVCGDRTYLRVTASLAYPLSDPHHFISIREFEGPEIGIIRDIREIDHESRQYLEQELRKRYFTPIISRFISIRHEFGAIYFQAHTDKGPKDFVVRGLRENVVEIQPGRFLIIDVDGNRFEVPDVSRLDQKSLVMWEKLI
jgi:hypothetical protein